MVINKPVGTGVALCKIKIEAAKIGFEDSRFVQMRKRCGILSIYTCLFK